MFFSRKMWQHFVVIWYAICLIIFVLLFIIYFVLGCKLNSLVLVYLFIQKFTIRTGRSLHHTPQIYIVVIFVNWVLIELSLQVINASDYTHNTVTYTELLLTAYTRVTVLILNV